MLHTLAMIIKTAPSIGNWYTLRHVFSYEAYIVVSLNVMLCVVEKQMVSSSEGLAVEEDDEGNQGTDRRKS